MKRYRPKWMDVLMCPKGHQGIYLNGKPYCLECKCPIEARGKGKSRKEADAEPQDAESQDKA
ncbi:MAG: hypothetical protein ACPMAQ_19220 [Phycisphaerae bacterium]